MAYRGTYKTASGKSVEEMLISLGQHAEADLGAELYEEAAGIISQAQQLTPVDTGTLRASGYVAEPKREGNRVRVEMGFGGPSAKINPKTGESADGYALYVHEDLNVFHKVGEALFLETAFNLAKRGMTPRIVEGLRKRGFGRYQTAMNLSLGEVEDGPA